MIAARDAYATMEEFMEAVFSVQSVLGLYNEDHLCKACTDRGLVCSAKGRIFNNTL
jgi:hypothetical protein